MRDGPNIANIAALIGDQARAEVLNVLMSGMALTATELADAAGVTRQTISAHLLESMMGSVRVRTSPREPALRKARVCYDHLAGALGTALLDRFQQLGWARRVPDSRVLAFSADGEAALRAWLD